MNTLLSCVVVLLLCVVGSHSAVLLSPIPCTSTNKTCTIQNIVWFSQTSAIINTGDNKMWKTTDEGQTFIQIGKNMNHIAQHPNNPLVMIMLSTSGTSFTYTLDGGVTFLTSQTAVGRLQVTKIHFHPTKIGTLMFVGRWTGPEQKCTLYSTGNWGQTWTEMYTGLVSNRVNTAAVWGNTTAEPDLIFVLMQDRTFGYTKDYKTFTPIFNNTLEFFKTRHYMFAVVPDEKYNNQLMSSSAFHDPSHTRPGSYVKATFPYGDAFSADLFTFLDDTTTAEYMALHMSYYRHFGDLYTSDSRGIAFQLSLAAVHKRDSDYDFHRIHGLNGIYIANTVQNIHLDNSPIITYITFDNGGEWRQLTPPKTDMNGNAWPCGAPGPDCMLHLHGEAASGEEILNVPSLRSHSNAIGVIIANGNVGPSLATQFNDLKTFLSRDAGLTWTQIFNQPTDFEFGDHGGIIVIAPILSTTHLYYSIDQGTTPFQPSNVSFPFRVTVFDIEAERLGTGLNFLIQTSVNESNYLFSYSLADLGLPNCGDSDYETWTPNDGTYNGECLMGMSYTYQRRKASSQCYNNRNTDVIENQLACPCSYEDYECASNYEPSSRDAETGKFTCTKTSEDPQCIIGDDYYLPTGYQLVPDTQCTRSNGLNLLGKQVTCTTPNDSSEEKKKGHGGVVAAVVIILLIVIAVGAFIGLYIKNERFKDFVTSSTSGLRNCCSSSGGQGSSYRGLTAADDDDDDNTV